MTSMDRLRAHIARLPPGYPITSGRLALALACSPKVASIYLRRLEAAGVVEAYAEAPVKAFGGRRSVLFRVRPPSSPPR